MLHDIKFKRKYQAQIQKQALTAFRGQHQVVELDA